jgi:hypothetical protein
MKRSYQKVPIQWPQRDSYLPSEAFPAFTYISSGGNDHGYKKVH